MKIFLGNLTMHSVCNMKRLFKRGERVRSKIDGKVMEVLRYLRNNLVEVMTFDLESREVRKKQVKEDTLSKAA